MKSQNAVQTAPHCDSLLDLDSFYITRVLANVALVKIGAAKDLRAAKVLMRRTARRIPGTYLIFSGRTRRVISRLVRRDSA